MDGDDQIEITVLGGLDEIAAADWDACAGAGRRAAAARDPFTTHRFLAALETSGSRRRPAPAGSRGTSSRARAAR